MASRDDAASPLTVVLTVVAVAVLVTGFVFWAFFGGPDPQIVLQSNEGGQNVTVTSVAADLRWEELNITLTDRGGFDHSGLLEVPQGEVREGQAIALMSRPPAGQYLLSVLLDGTEIERVVLRF